MCPQIAAAFADGLIDPEVAAAMRRALAKAAPGLAPFELDQLEARIVAVSQEGDIADVFLAWLKQVPGMAHPDGGAPNPDEPAPTTSVTRRELKNGLIRWILDLDTLTDGLLTTAVDANTSIKRSLLSTSPAACARLDRRNGSGVMTEQIDDRDRAAVPAGYRSLLLTYPRAWRAEHSEIVLDTVLTLHADTGRTRPGVADRLRFAIDGLRIRFAPEHPARPVHRFASVASLAPLRSFDQTNGIVSDGRPLSEWEQVHVNGARGANSDEQRVAPLAWFRLDATSRPDRHARRR